MRDPADPHTPGPFGLWRSVYQTARHPRRWASRAGWLALWAVVGVLAARGAFAATATVTTPQVQAELLAHAPEGVRPGAPLLLGLRLKHQAHWHTYWRNAGDSGLPTQLAYTLPTGFAAGDIRWPTPQRLPVGPLTNYGYEGTLLLVSPVTVPAGFAGQQLRVQLRADWLVCKEVCIPEGGDFVLDVPAQAATAAHASAFQAAEAALPRAMPGVQATARLVADGLELRVTGLPSDWQGQTLHLFPHEAGVLATTLAPTSPPQPQWVGGVWQSRAALDPQRTEAPSQLNVVLTAHAAGTGGSAGAAAGPGVQVAVAVQGAWPKTSAPAATLAAATTTAAAAAAPPEPRAGSALPDAAAAGSAGLLWTLLAAALGGLLLNLMPCVFPVLALKVMSVARAEAASRRHTLAVAWAYAGGVVASFVALAGVLLALRAAGQQLGWGFQLQSPLVVMALALLFLVIALNLLGVFEWRGVGTGDVAGKRLSNPVADAALTGVLAVAVASPCTAPFMGAALGAALTLPWPQALAVFAALGVGMAAPFVALSAWPALARRMPKPGAWMDRFKVLMAFPMLATVVWLLWVLGHQAGVDAVAAALGVMLAVALLAWVWGLHRPSGTRRWWPLALAAGWLAAVGVWAWPSFQAGEAPAEVAQSPTTPDRGNALTSPTVWQPWSPAAVSQALQQGRPVFVDFTAAWCVSCQVNKRTTLNRSEVLAALAERRVLLLRADWTRRDATISAELGRLGRSGVPVYALYAPGASPAKPLLLNELLSVGEVLTALAALPR